MTEGYPFKSVEARWRQRWEETGIYHTDLNSTHRKMYVLVMFAYPSEKKIHIGQMLNYGPTDTFARFKRMCGYSVFEPMGFDAFGLPAENFAIKHGVHPAVITRESINYIREQIMQIGAMFDWSREVDTSQPEYYRWTQWLFLQLFKTGAAYRKKAPVNWCPNCQTVLANEQVLSDGRCERCGTGVNTRDLEQWFFKITDFADQLIEGLNRIDWPEATKAMQRHWIGRSEGTEIDFQLDGHPQQVRCFTTRADTLFGVTYLVLAPEHELVLKITTEEHRAEVEEYIANSRQIPDIERLSLEREKSGVFTGATAINPANGERLPVWIADYVLSGYGTGAVMAVPAHDQRDFVFTERFELSRRWVIEPTNPRDTIYKGRAFEDYGIMHDSGQFDGLTSQEGMKAVTEWLASRGMGRATVSYRLRDWLISRQRYWGAPIPIIHCPSCGLVPVPEEELPVLLPEKEVDFTPRGTSPLASCKAFYHTECPKCGGSAHRDPDTMDTFVCSSWYFLRYPSADRKDIPFDPEVTRKWLPVDVYVGGPEHATGHLIYARYITKYLNSIGRLNFDEPFTRMVHQGIITHQGQRMSKSKGNVVNPEPFIEKYGADCFRLYLMFMGDYTVGGDWSDEGIIGIRRFQNRVWRLFQKWAPMVKNTYDETGCIDPGINRVMHHTIKEVTGDIDGFRFNTAISRLMEFVNELYHYISKPSDVDMHFLKSMLEVLTLLLGPFAPYMGEELWEMLGNKESIFDRKWPVWDENALRQEDFTLVVQVNGKLVEKLTVPKGSTEDQVSEKALESLKVKRHTSGKTIKKRIYIQDRILNLVV